MNPLTKAALLFFGAMAVSAVCAEASDAGGEPQQEGHLSASVLLGFKFHPPARTIEDVTEATQPTSPVFSDGVSPGTFVLPPYFLNEARVKLTNKEILTDKGRLEIAEKRYISPLYRTTFGPLAQLATYYCDWLSILGGWHPNEAEAMALYRQQERRLMLDEMDSLIRLETALDPKATKQFQRIRFGADVTSR